MCSCPLTTTALKDVCAYDMGMTTPVIDMHFPWTVLIKKLAGLPHPNAVIPK